MWSLATAHIAIDLHRGLLVFVNGDVGYFDDFSQPLSYARNTIYFVQALLGDAVLVWRCYVLCNRRVVIVALPLLSMLGCLFIAFGSGVIWSRYGNMTEAGIARTRTWSTAYFFLTIGANSYCTNPDLSSKVQLPICVHTALNNPSMGYGRYFLWS
ncbi:hypothetical protein HETIRDRAFT_413101 [Heterobasidion irregulare TC 32-1]|uniref:DUF4220 domain-containing protein n=1 Tax=Heterobasidion irregulare (strain TC 32-1) TaxID=747525 RepID=W4KNT9_HETIT|nr:uncharacterized protein HETIRDRAFT_413101 [Heterobasidion irregulare TC 32-1]ETW86716.1 hypothetical protein HETIRDRAFT_413101 [Heterobasidion irregulare TC 32-1]